MQTINVNIPNCEYEIKIEKGLLNRCGEELLQLFSVCRVAVISDTNVAPIYGEKLLNSLKSCGFDPFLVTVPAGESSKSIKMLEFLYSELLSNQMTRTDFIVALGGGVVGDLAGFCASTLLRGIPFVQIPTTLLAQVDSSVGGKVAVNLSEGKNLVGNFYQPKLVLIDPELLNTLDDRVFCDGMAEVIKYGVILDEQLFEVLEGAPSRIKIMNIAEKVIFKCCQLKKLVVEADERDIGGRMILNFGHTFGHAIEKQYNFSTYTHGEAVAAGMVMAAKYGESIGITAIGTADRITKLILQFNLPDAVVIDNHALKSAISVDKKGKGNMVSLIIPEKIGKVIIKDTEKDNICIH